MDSDSQEFDDWQEAEVIPEDPQLAIDVVEGLQAQKEIQLNRNIYGQEKQQQYAEEQVEVQRQRQIIVQNMDENMEPTQKGICIEITNTNQPNKYQEQYPTQPQNDYASIQILPETYGYGQQLQQPIQIHQHKQLQQNDHKTARIYEGNQQQQSSLQNPHIQHNSVNESQNQTVRQQELQGQIQVYQQINYKLNPQQAKQSIHIQTNYDPHKQQIEAQQVLNQYRPNINQPIQTMDDDDQFGDYADDTAQHKQQITSSNYYEQLISSEKNNDCQLQRQFSNENPLPTNLEIGQQAEIQRENINAEGQIDLAESKYKREDLYGNRDDQQQVESAQKEDDDDDFGQFQEQTVQIPTQSHPAQIEEQQDNQEQKKMAQDFLSNLPNYQFIGYSHFIVQQAP